jgi:hypothetical protein
MSEHQRETAFLRHCIGYDDTAECHKLEESITHIQRSQRCVRRAVWLMVLLAVMAMTGLCYRLVFVDDYPQELSDLAASFLMKALCALGLGSLICLVAFLALGMIYRKELNQRREECRRLATKLLESHLGRPRTRLLPGVVKNQQIVRNPVAAAKQSAEIVKLATGAVGISEIQRLIEKPL